MRKEFREVSTVAELRAFIADLPDDMPVGRMTNGHYQVNKIGDIGVFVGELPIGRSGEAVEVILRISA